MCGIVGAIAQRDVMGILLEGLKRLEYRGYDSSGVAIIDKDNQIQRTRRMGKVQELADALQSNPLSGGTGIAHTRWATHGVPSEDNAHPHVSGDGAQSANIAVVHNGIIENYQPLREKLKQAGYIFTSQTDTEVIAHLVHFEMQTSDSLLEAVQKSVKQFEGAYGTVVLDSNTPEKVIVARSGSPLVVGLGLDENFIASDMMALLPVTRNFLFLEEGDVAQITRFDVDVYDIDGNRVERESKEHDISHEASDKGEYRHYMMKEIYEQPTAIRNTLENGFKGEELNLDAFGPNAKGIFDEIEHVQIIACGTSYNSGMVARYWLESMANVSCSVEIASEFRYRKSFVPKKSLIVTLSQSGETADTLAALRLAKDIGYFASLCVCNVPGSSLVRESDLTFLTKAGVEIGVASTKAFTTQLVGLLMMTVALGRSRGMSIEEQKSIIHSLKALPNTIETALSLSGPIEQLAEDFADKHHSLFLGRGAQYPIAMEGALKLKEISYIHAEAYAAGELKHGPLALIDANMPVIVVAPNNELLEKLRSNVEEVRARGGLMYVFADANVKFESDDALKVVNVVHCDDVVAPIVYTVPLQLLSYYVAIIKGTDVDQPRNLAKSVTVE